MNERKAKPVTAAGRKRVSAALLQYGMLPIQGQHDIPSLADLLEGAAITTKGFSWDYVPAWDTSEAMALAEDVAMLALFRGANTLVSKRHWAAINVLSLSNVAHVLGGADGIERQEFLRAIHENPGLAGSDLKLVLGLESDAGGSTFQRIKRQLESLCIIHGEEQTEGESHTHDQLWYPWSYGKVAKAASASDTKPTLQEAATSLMETVEGAAALSKSGQRKLFPILKFREN